MLRINKTLDAGWFWSRYSINPYAKCSFACSYCFLNQNMFRQNQEKAKQKENLVDMLSIYPPDITTVSGYQHKEEKISKLPNILTLLNNYNFPVIVITKSPLVLRDIEILKKITENSFLAVIFSINHHSSENYLSIFEKSAPPIEDRFRAMEILSKNGIYTGTALMPIIPKITDNPNNLEKIILKTKSAGGQFVIAGGLVLSDDQKSQFFDLLSTIDPQLVPQYKELYKESFSPKDGSWALLGRLVRKLCKRELLSYRMPRFVSQYDPFFKEKKQQEQVFANIYERELNEDDPNIIEELRRIALSTENYFFDILMEKFSIKTNS